jgi:hypothetical protein
MTKIETDNDKALALIVKRNKKIQKKEQVKAFVKNVLGVADKYQAKMVRKFGSKHFKLADDGLAFRGIGGDLVDIHDPAVAAFFRKEFSFLPKTEGAAAETVELDPDLVAQAKAGNQTSRGALFRQIHGDKPRNEEAASYAAMEKILVGEEPIKDTPAAKKKIADDSSNNPWRLKEGTPGKQEAMAAKIEAIGTKACIGLARAAGCQINGKPLNV